MDKITLDPMFADLIADARKKAARKLKKKVKQVELGKESRIIIIRAHKKKRLAEARERRQKTGAEMCEMFLGEVAEPLARLMSREDVASLDGYRVIFRLSKGDQGAYSAHIEHSTFKSPRNFPPASIKQLGEKHNAEGWLIQQKMNKLSREGGANFHTFPEAIDEIRRLRRANKYLQQQVKDLKPEVKPEVTAENPSDEVTAENSSDEPPTACGA